LVVDPQVGEEDTVDAAVGGEPPVPRQLALAVRHDLQEQGLAERRKGRLDTGDEPGEERVRAEGLGRAGDHQPDRQRAGRRQGPGPVARGPAQLARGREDPVPGLGGDPRPSVERERHGALRDARQAGDVGDGGATRGHWI
jgi:hypothetical protein